MGTTYSLTVFIFFALVPLLAVADNIVSTGKLFRFTYLHMLLWNALTTWWIYNASAVGAAMAIFANSLIMCLPWLLMHLVKKKIRKMGRVYFSGCFLVKLRVFPSSLGIKLAMVNIRKFFCYATGLGTVV